MIQTHSTLLTMFKSVAVSFYKYDTIITNTRTIYFSCYPFDYNIQVKTFLKICWKNCILVLTSNAAIGAKCLKKYATAFKAFLLFLASRVSFLCLFFTLGLVFCSRSTYLEPTYLPSSILCLALVWSHSSLFIAL